MNIRKNIDYSPMFDAMDAVVTANIPQMELYRALGRLICARLEKGAAVAAAEYLKSRYQDASGFSPRNLRRMRDFYRMYGQKPDLLKMAMEIGWTQNVVILEADLNTEERRWYLWAVRQFRWSKVELQRNIESGVHLETWLDGLEVPCYTECQNQKLERAEHDQNTFYLSEKLWQKPNGRDCAERLCKGSWIGTRVANRIGNRQYRGTGQSDSLTNVWCRLYRQTSPAAPEQRLRAVRSADRHGLGRYAQYVSNLRRRFCEQNALVDGFFQSF